MDVLGRSGTEGRPTKALCDKITRITDIFGALLLSPPPVEQWPEWTSRLTALLAQYENALREMRPTLGRFLTVPNQIPVGGKPDFIPNVLLRTRMAPEVEEHLKRLQTEEETGNILRAVSQILQEGAESIKMPQKPSNIPLVTHNEDLLRAIRKHYTAMKM